MGMRMKNQIKKVIAVGYVRVSTDEQAEGFSLDAQEDRIRAYAESQDFRLLKIYRDDGYSAKNLDRPAMQELLKDLKQNVFDTILDTGITCLLFEK